MSQNTPGIFTLPLFPLHYVLFPQTPLPLHIFEERYRVMIADCIARDRPFGVVLIREGNEVGAPAVPNEIGCMARILDHQTLDDGRLNLIVLGTERFRLLEYMEADLPYLVGRVELWEDETPTEMGTETVAEELISLFHRYVRLLIERAGMDPPEIELPSDPALLSFYIGFAVQSSLAEKQHLLTLTDTRLRLETEIELLRTQIRELESPPAAAASGEDTAQEFHPVSENPDQRSRFRHDSRN